MEGPGGGMGLRSYLVVIVVTAFGLAWLPLLGPPAAAQGDATFTVDSTADWWDAAVGDGACDDGTGNCTLRAAIQEANARSGPDAIRFAIPGTGPHTIFVGAPEIRLPWITDSILIDATSQPGYAIGSPAVVLDGSALPDADGLAVFQTNTVTIQGLRIQNFGGDGIRLQGAQSQATDITVLGSIIDSNGGHGVSAHFESRVRIGSTSTGDANTITRNGGHGVYIVDTTDTIIEGNHIGTDASATSGLGNGGAGIAVAGASSSNVTILGNSMTGNAGLGIDLDEDGVTPSKESSTNPPDLESVTRPTPSSVVAAGTLDGGPGVFMVQLFQNDACDPLGFGEGARLVGSGEVVLAPGPVSFEIPLDENVAGGFLTGTSTRLDPETSEPSDTSEFGACLEIMPPAEVSPPEAPPTEDPPDETPPDNTLAGDDGTPPGSGGGDGPGEIHLTIYVNGQPISEPLNGVNGRIRIALEGDDGVEGRPRLYLVDQHGFEHYLGFVDEIDEIDTADFANGLYTLEIRDYGDPKPGVFTTAQAYTVVRAENILIQNAMSTPSEVLGAVAVTVGVVGLGALIVQTFWAQFTQVLTEAGKESGITVGEDRLRRHGLAKRLLGRQANATASLYTRRIGPWIAFLVAVVLLGFFFSFEGVDVAYSSSFFSELLPVLLIVGTAAFAFFVGQFALELLANRLSGASSRFRFLWPGGIALAISAVVFRTPFGYPGYVYEEEMEETRRVVRMKAIRALGVFAVMLTLLIPFILIGYRWRWDFAEAGIVVGLVALGTSTLPFAPLPGADVWRWRKTVSIPLIASTFALFFGFQLAFIPVSAFVIMGSAGLPVYLTVLGWLRVRSLNPVPGWYARFAGRFEAFEGWVDARTPAWWQRFRAQRGRAAKRAAGAMLSPIRRAAGNAARAVHRRRMRDTGTLDG